MFDVAGGPKNSAKVLDEVALAADLPGKKLIRGHVGTVVEVLDTAVFEAEFCDDEGRARKSMPGCRGRDGIENSRQRPGRIACRSEAAR